MRPIAKRSIVDTVVDAMREEISAGRWVLGERIPSEAELTQALQVSRPSVREAVRALVQLGLLDSRQGDGTYLVATDPTQVALRRALGSADTHEVIRVRRALDALAAREAALNCDAHALQTLSEHLARRAAAGDQGDIAAFADADVAFHLGVARASGNQLLAALYESFDGSIRDSVTTTSCIDARGPRATGPSGTTGTIDAHEALLDAIAAQDPDLAEAAALGVLDDQERLLHADN